MRLGRPDLPGPLIKYTLPPDEEYSLRVRLSSELRGVGAAIVEITSMKTAIVENDVSPLPFLSKILHSGF